MPNPDQTYHIRDRRGPRRYFVDNTFIRGGWAAALGPYPSAIYHCLAMFASADDQSAWPSLATLAGLSGMSRRQTIYSLHTLQHHRLITIQNRHGTSNLVTLLHPDEWAPPVHQVHPTRAPGAPHPVHQVHPTRAPGAQLPMHLVHPNNTHENQTTDQNPAEHAGTHTQPDPAADALWSATLPLLHDTMPYAAFQTWISPCQPLSLGDALIITCANVLARQHLADRLRATIEAAVAQAAGHPVPVKFR